MKLYTLISIGDIEILQGNIGRTQRLYETKNEAVMAGRSLLKDPNDEPVLIGSFDCEKEYGLIKRPYQKYYTLTENKNKNTTNESPVSFEKVLRLCTTIELITKDKTFTVTPDFFDAILHEIPNVTAHTVYNLLGTTNPSKNIPITMFTEDYTPRCMENDIVVINEHLPRHMLIGNVYVSDLLYATLKEKLPSYPYATISEITDDNEYIVRDRNGNMVARLNDILVQPVTSDRKTKSLKSLFRFKNAFMKAPVSTKYVCAMQEYIKDMYEDLNVYLEEDSEKSIIYARCRSDHELDINIVNESMTFIESCELSCDIETTAHEKTKQRRTIGIRQVDFEIVSEYDVKNITVFPIYYDVEVWTYNRNVSDESIRSGAHDPDNTATETVLIGFGHTYEQAVVAMNEHYKRQLA